MSTFLYGANVHANGIRQHYLRYGGSDGTRASRDAVVVLPGITSPAVTWGFVGERFGRVFDTYLLDIRGRGLTEAADAMDYSLDAQAQGSGLMDEALQTMLAEMFGPNVHLHRIQAAVRPENLRSRKVLLRLGFEQEGFSRRYLHINGAWRDHEVFALLNPHWPQDLTP